MPAIVIDPTRTAPPNQAAMDHLELYRTILLIRLCEERLAKSHQRGLIHGACHTYVGQEAIAAGVCANLDLADMVFSTHRGHGHALAKGVAPRQLFAELYGRVDGCSRGRGGSMHLFAPEVGLMGTSGIVGPCILQAAGAGYSFKLLKRKNVAVAFFGDGAVNNGAFHEGLNLASIWKLPVLFVCENNQYATEVPFSYAAGNSAVAERGAAYGLNAMAVDGNEVLAVRQAAREAVERARNDGGPTLIECKTYRTRPHAEGMGDFSYRTREEVERWKTCCPIKRLRQHLIENRLADEAEIAALETEVAALVEEAHEFAEKSPMPPKESATQHIFSDAPHAEGATGSATESTGGRVVLPLPRRGGEGRGEGEATTSQEVSTRPLTLTLSPSDSPPRLAAAKRFGEAGSALAKRGGERGSPDRVITFMKATLEALTEEFANNPKIFVLGEGIGQRGGNFATTTGLFEKYGAERLRDTPICERGFVGLACGAAMSGTRPVVDFMFADFVLDAAGEIINQIAKIQYMSSGRLKMPVLLRGCIGIGHSAATHHSGSYYSMYAHFPGLRIVVPSSPRDAKGLLKTALNCDDPVLFLEHRELLAVKGPVPTGEYSIEFGQAAVVRAGTSVTVVALAVMVYKTLKACELLASEGISVELIDPRTVSPLDLETILKSVARTGRLLIADESFGPCGIGAEIAAQIADRAFDDLDAPIRRLNGLHTPTPYSPSLESAVIPGVAEIAQAIRDLCSE